MKISPYHNATTEEFFDVAPRQRPDPAAVYETQRRRLMLGIIQTVAQKGYPDSTVADVLANVRVSRRTFYEHFKDKEDCFLAAYEMAQRALVRAVKESQRGITDPIERIEIAHSAWLAFIAKNSEVGLAVLRGVYSSGARITEQYDKALQEFADLLAILHDQCKTQIPSLPTVPAAAFQGLVFAINKIMARELMTNGSESVMQLLPSMLYLTYSVFGLNDLAVKASKSCC